MEHESPTLWSLVLALPALHKAALALAALLAVLVTVTGWVGLPAQVRAQGAAIEQLQRQDQQLIRADSVMAARMDRALCYLQSMNGERPVSECVR